MTNKERLLRGGPRPPRDASSSSSSSSSASASASSSSFARSSSSSSASGNNPTLDDLLAEYEESTTVRDTLFFLSLVALAAFHILLALRVGEHLALSWLLVFLPLYTLGVALVLLALVHIVVTVTLREYTHPTRRVLKLAGKAVTVAVLLFFINLVHHKLKTPRGPRSPPFWLVAAPLLLLQGGALARDLVWTLRMFRRKGIHFLSRRWSGKHNRRVVRTLLQSILAAASVLLTLKLAAVVHVSWWVVFTPLWIFLPALVLAICFSGGKAGVADAMFSTLVFLVVVLPLFLFLFFLCSSLENGFRVLSFTTCSIPMFCCYGILFCARVVQRCQPVLVVLGMRSARDDVAHKHLANFAAAEQTFS